MKTVKKEIGGRPLIIESGKVARQADGGVFVRYGETVVLSTVVTDPEEKVNAGFVPLTVDYREKHFAAGKIPGGFYKREGRPTIKEILTMRLIDRSIRPMVADGYNHEVQITNFVFSADQDNDPDIISITGSSIACLLAQVPLRFPVASVRIGRVDNQFILNPTYSQLEKSELNLVVSGSQDAIVMVEGETHELSENVVIDAILWGHQYIKELVALQLELVQQASLSTVIPQLKPAEIYYKIEEKRKEMALTNQSVVIEDVIKNLFPLPFNAAQIQKVYTEQSCYQKLYQEVKSQFATSLGEALMQQGKKFRQSRVDELYQKIKAKIFADKAPEAQNELLLREVYADIEKELVRKWITEGKRIDGRGLKDIRPISCEVGLLPRTHGSSLFTRGETQALVTVTLGTPMDEQVVEGLVPEYSKHFMLHYNFPPFCVGEMDSLKSPSRREIGHGNLAERALANVLPDDKRFPYTIRIVSEILESNGSSSMASICGGTLALMDAGVPIKRPVAGIAMGLVKTADSFYVLSDIMGTEDHYGDMDFKVAGTQRGISALQMDIKTSGISREVFVQALEQAKEGRIFILREMMAVLDHPKREISNYAPKIVQIKIKPEKIAAIIGPGGKTIRGMQENTGASIDIKDDGLVTIYCKNKEGALKAQELVSQLTEEVKVGQIYKGRVTAIKEFGAFVEIMPGTEGLVHVSELEKDYVANVSDVVKMGDEITVKVLAIDEQNRIKLSKRAAEREQKTKEPR